LTPLLTPPYFPLYLPCNNERKARRTRPSLAETDAPSGQQIKEDEKKSTQYVMCCTIITILLSGVAMCQNNHATGY
jgi:hypothetical protein